MKKRLTYQILPVLVISFLSSCDRIKDTEDYLRWLNNPENGLTKEKTVNGYHLKVKYLPPEYLTHLELNNKEHVTKRHRDSILQTYQNAITFVFMLEPDETRRFGEDIMMTGVNNYPDYSQRVYTMNFLMKEYFTLTTGTTTRAPVLCSIENTYGLKCGRNFLVVFAEEDLKPEENTGIYDFVFTDAFFFTGENHFLFRQQDIDNRPAFPKI